jgi:hypothetical protein
MFNFVTKTGSIALSIFKFAISSLVWIALWVTITATSFLGIYFVSSAAMVVFSIVAAIAGIMFVVWFISFVWKVIRFFYPKEETPNEPISS